MMFWIQAVPRCIAASLAWGATATVSLSAQAATQAESFDRRIAPVLAANCLECHSGGKAKGQLDLSRRATALRGGESGPAIVAGDPGKSLLWQRIEADEMPPKHVLPAADKKLIREWIQGGARWGSDPIDPFRYTTSRRAGYDWWSLQPLAKPPVPKVEGDRWSKNTIDRFIRAKLQEKALEPSKRGDPRTLVRRLYIDLIGLPPSAEVIDTFARDPSEKKWERLVDVLLASDHHGERWARHWLDVVRFGESDGYEYNSPRHTSWRYRDWVIRALDEDMPYDKFARMQLAGDILEPNTIEGAAAVGFLVAGTHNTVLGKSERMKLVGRHEELEEIAGTVAQTFLGLTVNCARCHDHKFDPITTREYYSFIAALDGVNHGQRSIATKTDASDQAELTAKREVLERRRVALQERLTKSLATRGTQRTTANQLWTKSVDANVAGRVYRVSLKIAPSTWASASQATSDRDGVSVSLRKKDRSALTSERFRPGAWNGGRGAANYTPQSFEYTGDGQGPIRIHLAPFPRGSGRFGGAVDDLKIEAVASGKVLFEESFDQLRDKSAPGSQADTRRRVFYGAKLARWEHSGLHAIHAVEHSDGNLALQLFGGHVVRRSADALEPAESRMQTEIKALEARLQSIRRQGETKVFTVVSRQPGIMRVRVRGDVMLPTDEVAACGIESVKNVSASFGIGKAASDAQRRRALATWITDPENGPFHRVAVNRIWHYHFGQGIVTSPSDLGFNGDRPSHPALLEWLACWFRENGYSMKKLHKLIVMSATYQQSSLSNSAASRIDKENRLLWRQNPRRVEAEVLRDSLLLCAGQLNETRFGPGYRDVAIVTVPPAFYYKPIDPTGETFRRRTIYRWHVRGRRSALLDTFDCPDPSAKTPRRIVTTTPSQALSQWNHGLVLRMSMRLAERVGRELPGDAVMGQRVDLAWRLVLGRSPSADERAKSARLVRDHGLVLLCRVLFNSNEFVVID